jgi:Rrf2 family transcriptional regulator, cysteine metabolism repressor
MKISFKGDYALKIILDLALTHGQDWSQMKDIAQRQDIPLKFLEQIVLALKAAGYISTSRGRKGGVALAKAPERITLGEIVRLIDGPTSPIACVSTTGYRACGFEARCVFKTVFQEIKERTNAVLDQTTFAEMAERTRQVTKAQSADFCI